MFGFKITLTDSLGLTGSEIFEVESLESIMRVVAESISEIAKRKPDNARVVNVCIREIGPDEARTF